MADVVDLGAGAVRPGYPRRRNARIALIGLCLAASSCSSKPQQEQPAEPIVDPKVFQGNWIVVDHDSLGHAIYVEKGSIRDAEQHTKTADIALVDETGRMLERVSFDCSTRGVTVVSQIGSVENSTADITGDLPRENGPHSSVLDYVCEGKLSEPEASTKPVTEVPARLPG